MELVAQSVGKAAHDRFARGGGRSQGDYDAKSRRSASIALG